MAKLTFRNDATKSVPLVKIISVIGRGPNSDVLINDPSVSQSHASLTLVYDEFVIENLDVSNPTRVNGKAVTKHMLVDEDVISLGNCEVVFHAEGASERPPVIDLDKTGILSPRAAFTPLIDDAVVLPKRSVAPEFPSEHLPTAADHPKSSTSRLIVLCLVVLLAAAGYYEYHQHQVNVAAEKVRIEKRKQEAEHERQDLLAAAQAAFERRQEEIRVRAVKRAEDAEQKIAQANRTLLEKNQVAEERRQDKADKAAALREAMENEKKRNSELEESRERAWRKYYTEPDGCIDSSTWSCIHKRTNAKTAFENAWNSGLIKH